MSQPPKKHGLWCRVFRRRGGGSAGSPRGPANVVNPGGGRPNSDRGSTHSAPTYSPHVGISTSLQCRDPQLAIPQSESAIEISEHLHFSTPTNQAGLHDHHILAVPSQPHDHPLASGAPSGLTPSVSGRPHAAIPFPSQSGSPSQFFHPASSPSGGDGIEFLHPAALSVPSSGDLARQRSYQSLSSAVTPSEVPRTRETRASFLAGASGFTMRDIHYHEAPHMPADRGGAVGGSSIDGWELLMKKTAINALYNSRARFDAPKCDEDTRVGVTSELMDWMHDRGAPQRLLCMTGAAGSGKSCLQQTAAEKCGKNNILAASFFLSAQDSTRDTVDPVIPTIAYQLGRGNLALRALIKAAVERDPLIFDQSLEAQTTVLIVEPVESLRDSGADVSSLPYAILIDGLDEAKGEDRQAELLTAIRKCLLENELPFHIFIASRPEWAIHTALHPGGHLHDLAYHIKLSSKYDATADMRRYLRSRFKEIGLRINDPLWFSQANIETLVKAGSGQFIYVATVYKYISERRASPKERLDTVLTWTPRQGQVAKPFEALDTLYYSILSAAQETYNAVDTHRGRDFLLLLRAHHVNIGGFKQVDSIDTFDYSADTLSVLLYLEPQAEATLVSDLRSLVALEKDRFGVHRLHLYHKSFSDFLEEPTRAKDLFIPESRVYTHLSKSLMRRIIECPLDFESIPAKWEELPLSELDKCCLKKAVEDLPRFLASPTTALDDDEVVSFTQNGGWQRVNKLLPLLYCSSWWIGDFFGRWIAALLRLSGTLEDRKPETAAVIKGFTAKWEADFKRLLRAQNKDQKSYWPTSSPDRESAYKFH